MTTLAIELFFDDASDRSLRDLWADLQRRGIPPSRAVEGRDYHPHVTLSVFDASEPLPEDVRDIATASIGRQLVLSPIAFFVDAPRIITHLGVIPSSWLLDAHDKTFAVLDAAGFQVRGYYAPDRWMPHCSLPVEVSSRDHTADAVEAAAAHRLPATVTVDRVLVIDLDANGSVVERLA